MSKINTLSISGSSFCGLGQEKIFFLTFSQNVLNYKGWRFSSVGRATD